MKSFCGRDTPHFPHAVSRADRSGQCYGVPEPPTPTEQVRRAALGREQRMRVEEIARKAYGGGPDVRFLLGLVDVLCARLTEEGS